jgi:hypothetical protein
VKVGFGNLHPVDLRLHYFYLHSAAKVQNYIIYQGLQAAIYQLKQYCY